MIIRLKAYGNQKMADLTKNYLKSKPKSYYRISKVLFISKVEAIIFTFFQHLKLFIAFLR